jgi:hypothetical protein
MLRRGSRPFWEKGNLSGKMNKFQFSSLLLPEVVAGSVPPAFVFCDGPSY